MSGRGTSPNSIVVGTSLLAFISTERIDRVKRSAYRQSDSRKATRRLLSLELSRLNWSRAGLA
jgi:hypothetical protein